MRKPQQAKKGLTLSELLLAAAILAFVLSALLYLFINILFLNETNRNTIIATSHAQFVMEDIRGTSFSAIRSEIDNNQWDWATTPVDEISLAGLEPLSAENITACCWDSTSAACFLNCPFVNPLEINVTVEWQDRRQRQREIELRTLITR